MRTAKLQPVFAAAVCAADPDHGVDGEPALRQLGLDRHEAHGRTLHGFADGGSIGGVVLAAPAAHAVRGDELRGHQPHGMAEAGELARPVVRARTRFHADGAGRQPGHQLGELIAPDLRTHQARLAGRIHAVQREDILGQIDPEKHHRHGHLLAARSRGLSFCRPMVRAGQALRLLAESSVPGAVRGDGPFIR